MPEDLQARIEHWLAQEPWRQAAIGWLRKQGVAAYLVGGTVRDALLGVQGRDLDLAIDGDALAAGRGLADFLGGAFVPLDVMRLVCRVVIRTSEGFGQDHIDLAGLRGADIEADLAARDLTVNAMALQVSPSLGTLLDPTGGLGDLDARKLRVAGPRAFADDPLRLLRLARMRGKLEFQVEPETLTMMAAHHGSLADVSSERVRDELFLMLDQQNAVGAIGFASLCHLWEPCLPMAITEQGLSRLALLEQWLSALDGINASGDVPAPLQMYRNGLLAHWAKALCSGRPRRSLAKLVALGWPSGGDTLRQVGRYLCLSTAEVRHLAGAATDLARSKAALCPLTVYRHYRTLGEAGVDAAVLSMVASPQEGAKWRLAAYLLDGWFRHHADWVDPPRLATGGDAIAVAGLAPGPAIGDTLERLRQAQVLGEIATRQEALAWLGAQRERPNDRVSR